MSPSRITAVLPLCALALMSAVRPAAAQSPSFYASRLDDPQAVYLTSEHFSVRGDGVADDTAAIQAAIDKVEETTGEGIVLIPSGRYRLTTTVNVWGGIRLIGYGATRPVFVLGPNTPGYGDANQEKYLVFFSGRRPGAGGGAPRDAGAGTFYSALSNVDIEIGDGNPGAVGVRGRYAQHSFIAHSDVRIGSGLAGVHDTGNVMEDVHFHGGDSAGRLIETIDVPERPTHLAFGSQDHRTLFIAARTGLYSVRMNVAGR